MSISITWHGVSCFKIKSKIRGEEVGVVTDPYDSSCGLRVPKILKADIVTSSQNHPHHNNVGIVESLRGDKDIFIIKNPGEYEVGGIFVYGITHSGEVKEPVIIYRFEISGFSIAHIGNLNFEPTAQELEAIGDVDILFVPVDGPDTIDFKKINSVISAIDPQIVVPMNYKIPKLTTKAEPVEKLLKELGVKDVESVKKLKLARKDFGEEMKVIVIEKD
ncbi:MAG: MBL fold metallo-hydrolase [Patescibacteria group bacterium]|nr:MBL fold metallo-hydrolase [Patescibacteria group bacterium]